LTDFNIINNNTFQKYLMNCYLSNSTIYLINLDIWNYNKFLLPTIYFTGTASALYGYNFKIGQFNNFIFFL